MKKILITLIVFLLMICAVMWVDNYSKKNVVHDDSEPESINGGGLVTNMLIESEIDEKDVMSCYDAIDSLLKTDGFTYIEGARWGRGENNFFVFDLASMEFRVADYFALEVLPVDWYENYYKKYVSYTYSYTEKTLVHEQSIIHGNLYNYKEDDYTMYPEELNNTKIFYYEIPIWMDYYASEIEKMGCSLISDLEKLENTASKYGNEDVVSVFDLKSTDGVVRYFNDVYTEGDVKDHPKYKEIQSVDEYFELKKEDGNDYEFWVSIINHDKNKVYERGIGHLQASVIEHFIKDVGYTFVPDKEDKRFNQTIAMYFIDVDNPNGNFKDMYIKPIKGKYYSANPDIVSFDLRELRMPFEGTMVLTRRDTTSLYSYVPVGLWEIRHVLDMFIHHIVSINPSVNFSESFVRDYTRPFDYDWQKMMGLDKLFDEKYGLIDHDIKYMD